METFICEITIPIEITYTIEPGQKGLCDSMGVPEEPSYEAYVDEVEFELLESLREIEDRVRKRAEERFEEGE